MTQRILIWGAGAVGAPVGAALLRAGHFVTFVDMDAAHVAAMRDPERGLVISGPEFSFSGAVDALTPDEVAGDWPVILLCVKAHHTRQAAEMLAPHLDANGCLVTLQNGLVARVAADVLGGERVLPGFINFGADRHESGHVAFGNRGTVAIGEMEGGTSARLDALWQLLKTFEPDAIRADDIWAYLWGKLAYASLLFAQAVGEGGIAATLDRPELTPLWRALAGETLAVARTEGVTALGFAGFDPAAFAPDADPAAAVASIAAVADFNRASAKTHSGVWRDLAIHRRQTEADAQLGMVVEIGARHGIACPALSALIAMIHAIERGERAQHDDNLTELTAMIEPVYAAAD
ncbi:MAG: 2-dehydropantoate 2-reductase [Alphaproteobacteria bacterium HGW-Alphaproteobacteria-16]|nr:MAG: 2-dehydropantoate 2-reductase [Alphaproteobacteria bacterium HGW-Alphaproteobacteria-16]